LHLHGVLFTKKSLTPQEIRNHIMDQNSDFNLRLIKYLESIQMGQFMTGPKEQVQAAVSAAQQLDSYVSPELTLPIPPPIVCECLVPDCNACTVYKQWFDAYKFTVDDLLLKSNLHDCFRAFRADGTIKNVDMFQTSCLNNRWKRCKARFPRATRAESTIDPDTGHIDLKKEEAWLNDVCAAFTYLTRGNVDVTSLLSGTAIKSVILYIADYITKVGLKTHAVFDGVKTIFDK
ncbi:hypothetical protein F5877DRAFT_21197, partial [Lentinula edodes]